MFRSWRDASAFRRLAWQHWGKPLLPARASAPCRAAGAPPGRAGQPGRRVLQPGSRHPRRPRAHPHAQPAGRQLGAAVPAEHQPAYHSAGSRVHAARGRQRQRQRLTTPALPGRTLQPAGIRCRQKQGACVVARDAWKRPRPLRQPVPSRRPPLARSHPRHGSGACRQRPATAPCPPPPAPAPSPWHMQDVFFKDLPDGANCLAVGQLGGLGAPALIVGGNGCVQALDGAGRELFWAAMSDAVQSMALVDVDGDGELELVVSLPSHGPGGVGSASALHPRRPAGAQSRRTPRALTARGTHDVAGLAPACMGTACRRQPCSSCQARTGAAESQSPPPPHTHTHLWGLFKLLSGACPLPARWAPPTAPCASTRAPRPCLKCGRRTLSSRWHRWAAAGEAGRACTQTAGVRAAGRARLHPAGP